MLNNAVATVCFLAIVGIGVCIGYFIWGRQVDVVVEGHATPISMDDGSLVVAREPDGKTTIPDPERPKGTTVVRTVEATVSGGKPVLVQPDLIVDRCPTAADFSCPPVSVRVDLLRDTHGTYRAQVTSNTGEVLDGVDIPREPIIVPKRLNWSAGYERDMDGKQGAFLARDVGRLVIGASVNKDAVTGRIGWRF